MKNLCFWILVVLNLGCQTTSDLWVKQQEILNDSAFDGFQSISIETEAQIFALNEEATIFARESIKGIPDPAEQIQSLVKRIFSRSDLNLLYRAEANTTAIQTFQNRAANCLSMSIMTYALARKLGFGGRFQDIEIPEYWTMREGQSLLNRHINLQILPKPDYQHFQFVTQGFEVDFDAQATRPHFPKTLLKLNHVVAMFYNNQGADALLQRDDIRAYAYFRAAIKIAPNLPSTMTNLGYLYRLNQEYALAEAAYQRAINLDSNHLTAWNNLSHLYRYMEREEEAQIIVRRIERKRAGNPFFHINMGNKAFAKNNWQGALTHYRQALKLDKSQHETFFGLAKVYFQLGNLPRSHHYLKLAKKKSRTEQEFNIYQGKIDFLVSHKSKRGLNNHL